jgi:hydroxysqualene synthase
MTDAPASAEDLRSGKGHRDENFPVASHLIRPRHRPIILAFYNFVRAADDVADHAGLATAQKLALLDGLEASLVGRDDAEPAAVALRRRLAERQLPPRHAQDLLTAFRRDATQLRYRDWDELIDYCRYSAMPVGRFVLDVHGESRATWPANDALCAALQVINHLQDCAADYRSLDRVYIPLDAFEAAGLTPEVLASACAPAPLRDVIRGLAERTGQLLREAEPLAVLVDDLRLGLEIAVIQRLACRLTAILMQRDPLSERVHLSAGGVARLSLLAVLQCFMRRLVEPRRQTRPMGEGR